MCIIIDACTISSVFSSKNEDHLEFKPVLDWIINGKGKIVYGGRQYKLELSKLQKYTDILVELRKMGKIVEISDKDVDNVQNELERQVNKKDFDDAHIVAIVIVSRCLLVCTKEQRAIPYLKDRNLYPNKVKKPKVYSRQSNKNLLTDKNVARICA